MYSQNKEDERIWGYFQQRGIPTGRLLDIGANDGITLSNSRMFIERGWFADLVEPSPAAFRKLSECKLLLLQPTKHIIDYEYYKYVDLHNFAITNETGEIDFWECDSHLTKNDVSLLATADVNHVERWKRHKSAATGKAQQFTLTKVKSYRWVESPLFEQKYDYITIDTEGYNLQIFEQINLSNVQCICVEWANNPADLQDMIDHAAKYGLGMYNQNFENVIFTR